MTKKKNKKQTDIYKGCQSYKAEIKQQVKINGSNLKFTDQGRRAKF